jgi:hypothetical protein
MARLIPAPEADLEPTACEQVGDGDVLGQSQRVPEGRDQHGLAEAQARCAGAGARDHQQRVGRVAVVGEVVLGDPCHVQAQTVGELDLAQRVVEALGSRRHLGAANQVEGAETHVCVDNGSTLGIRSGCSAL